MFFNRLMFFLSIALIFLFSTSLARPQTPLNGIRCDLLPSQRVDSFKMPVLPVGNKTWLVTNKFGNRVTNQDVPGLPAGAWQHTGVDYLLGGSSSESQNQPVYAAANGIVVFSTKSNPNPVPARGGLIIIRHLAPQGSKFSVVKYDGAAGSYAEFETEEVYTYYLHLDTSNILVETGENVSAGQQIAQTYDKKNKKYVYVPHLHFEVWSACSKTELNGYEPDGTLKKSLRNPVIDPISFLSNVQIKGATNKTPPVKTPLPQPIKQPPVKIIAPEIPTLFLFDVSGSMSENNKIEQARAAGLRALGELKENRRLGRDNSPVSIWVFSGDCQPVTARQILPFTSNLSQAETVMRSRIPAPDGGTPLPQAVDRSVAQMLDYLNATPNINFGRIILLSDGQSTCGEIRPAGIYSRAKLITFRKVNFLTIGYDIQAGSQAERDLQYLASASGGRYFPANNGQQLSRAFEKTIRIYIPKNSSVVNADFERGVRAILNRDFSAALQIWTIYVQANPGDSSGFYNLALVCEALEFYRAAAENYRKYLSVAPAADDTGEISARIGKAEDDYRDKLLYYANLLRSDLAYLKAYYQRLFGVKNAELAAEFAGFVDEKRDFYANLPLLLEMKISWLRRGSEELTDSLGRLNNRVNLPSFDRDAVSLLTLPISQLEELVEKLDAYNAQNFR